MTRASRHGRPYDTRRLRIGAVLAGIAGVLALVAGGALLFVLLPLAMDEERAFRTATECRGPVSEECLSAAWFTVETVHVRRGKNPGGTVRVSRSGEVAAEVTFSGIGDFLEHVRQGDRVAGTLWQGEIIVLSDGGAAQRTDDHPAGTALFAAGFGILLVLNGGFVACAAHWALRHLEAAAWRRKPATATSSGWAVAGLSVWAFILMVVLDGREASLGPFLTLWSPAALVASALLIHRHRRLRTRR
ncbi:hypothetical protein [Streptomyces sp. NPDC008122]|uniref:hypothetical protein n=1 Tax=Streptomyces sp. NPDC008122 TaxID=3364810 RepID=UPI0036EDD7C2